MNIKVLHEKSTPEEYVNLRIKTGMDKKDITRSKIAIDNSLYVVSVYDEDKLIGFGLSLIHILFNKTPYCLTVKFTSWHFQTSQIKYLPLLCVFLQ